MAFRSAVVKLFVDKWGLFLRFRASYALSGNRIVNQRTIKSIAKRGRITAENATFWDNVKPHTDVDEGSVPSNVLFL